MEMDHHSESLVMTILELRSIRIPKKAEGEVDHQIRGGK